MAGIGARLAILEALEAENVKLREFIEDVAHTYGLGDVQDIIERAGKMSEGWA